jgi:hypothetical protein
MLCLRSDREEQKYRIYAAKALARPHELGCGNKLRRKVFIGRPFSEQITVNRDLLGK